MKAFFVFLLFSTSIFAQDADQSYIEAFMKGYDKVPTSFSEFLQDLKQVQFKGAATTNSVDFPVSRSLQKGNTSYKFPRQVVSINVSAGASFAIGGPPPDQQMFIGYAPEAGELEVISWNPSKNKYEFFQVENFAPGKKPTLKRSEEKTCLKCHQAGGPIFTHFPWAESNQTADSDVAQKHRKKTEAATLNMTEKEIELKRFSTNIDFNNGFSGGIFGLDFEIRNANKRLVFAKMCQDLKKSPKMEEVLQKAILSNHPDVGAEEKAKLQTELKAILGSDYSHPSSVLIDHNPTNELLGDRGPVRIITSIDDFKNQNNSLNFNPQQNNSFSEMISGQPISFNETLSTSTFNPIQGLPTSDAKGLKTIMQSKTAEGSFLNPLTQRPNVGRMESSTKDFQSSVSACIMNDSSLLDSLSSIPFEDLKEILRKAQLTKSKEPKESLKTAINAFYEEAECIPEDNVLNKETKELSEDAQKIVLELVKQGLDIKQPIDDKRAFENIQKSCKECHDAKSDSYFGIDIKYPETKEDMEKFAKHNMNSSSNSPLMRIFDKSMPADKKLPDKEREEMMIYILKFLK